VRPVPVEFAHSVAIAPEDFDRIDGQVLAYAVKSGDMILWGLMEGKRVPTFSARVEAGHRAMTVPVDEINSISGMLEPGDMIDLMVTIDQRGKKVAFPLMQSATVMATGQRSMDDPKSGERRQYSTVTLDTTPEQAHHVIVAREIGKITALLRNPQDKQSLPNSGADVALMLGIKGGHIAGGEVPVLYGGGSGKLPADGMTLAKPAGSGVTNVAGPTENPAPTTGPMRQISHTSAAR
jgi:pilus assembly protein CpaB